MIFVGVLGLLSIVSSCSGSPTPERSQLEKRRDILSTNQNQAHGATSSHIYEGRPVVKIWPINPEAKRGSTALEDVTGATPHDGSWKNSFPGREDILHHCENTGEDVVLYGLKGVFCSLARLFGSENPQAIRSKPREPASLNPRSISSFISKLGALSGLTPPIPPPSNIYNTPPTSLCDMRIKETSARQTGSVSASITLFNESGRLAHRTRETEMRTVDLATRDTGLAHGLRVAFARDGDGERGVQLRYGAATTTYSVCKAGRWVRGRRRVDCRFVCAGV